MGEVSCFESYSECDMGLQGSDRFSEELLESENDRRIESVANKVSTLKHVSDLLFNIM